MLNVLSKAIIMFYITHYNIGLRRYLASVVIHLFSGRFKCKFNYSNSFANRLWANQISTFSKNFEVKGSILSKPQLVDVLIGLRVPIFKILFKVAGNGLQPLRLD